MKMPSAERNSTFLVTWFNLILLFTKSGSMTIPFETEIGKFAEQSLNGPGNETSNLIEPFEGESTVEPGVTLVISCSKPNTDPAQVVWDREVVNGGTIAVGGNVQQSPEKYSVEVIGRLQKLTIKDIQIEDDGIYRCYTLFNQDYDRTTINVVVPPTQFDITVTPESVNEESYATIKCIVGPSKPAATLEWSIIYEDGRSIEPRGFESDLTHPNGTVSRTSELNIQMTRELYAAAFVCSASVTTANYSETNKVTVNTNLRPDEPYLIGFDDYYIEGQVVTLSCVAPNGKPEADIMWYWDGSATNGRIEIKPNENGTVDTTSTLIFNALPQHNNNFFVCSVSNKVMSDKGEQPKRTNNTLVVKYQPQLVVDTTPQTAFEGFTLVLACQSSGFPNPIMSTWLHNGYPVLNDSRRAISGDIYRPTLYISSVNSTDKGAYQCESTNEIGTSVSDVLQVTVLHSPLCKPRRTRKFGTGILGSVEVTCWIEAYPNNGIIFGWNYNGSWEIGPGLHDPLDPDLVYSKLNYTVRKGSDYKDIECKADNGVGNMEQSCVYSILPPGPAEAPNDCMLTNLTSSWASVDCWEEYNGGSPPSYMLEAAKGSEAAYTRIANSSTPQFSVSLLPDTTYYMRVCATNRDFWQSYKCSQNFRVITPYSNDTVTVAPPVGMASAPYIAVGVIFGVLLIVIIIIAVVIVKRRNRKAEELESPPPTNVHVEMRQKPSAENLDESYNLATDVKVTSLDTSDHLDTSVPATYSQINTVKAHEGGEMNASFAIEPSDMGEPLYDSADGITGVISAAALADLVLQAEDDSQQAKTADNLGDIPEEGTKDPGFDNAALVIDVETNVAHTQAMQPEPRVEPTDVSMIEPEPEAATASGAAKPGSDPTCKNEPVVESETTSSQLSANPNENVSPITQAQTEDIIDALHAALSSAVVSPPEKPQRLSSDDKTKL